MVKFWSSTAIARPPKDSKKRMLSARSGEWTEPRGKQNAFSSQTLCLIKICIDFSMSLPRRPLKWDRQQVIPHAQMLLCRNGQAQDPSGCEGRNLKGTSGHVRRGKDDGRSRRNGCSCIWLRSLPQAILNQQSISATS